MNPPPMPNLIAPSRRRGPVLAVLAVAAIIGVAAIATMTVASGRDSLSVAEAAQRESAFTGSVALPLVAVADRDAAIDAMALPPQARASLEADVEAGRTGLAWLSLWDDQAADGDRVRISAGGFALDLDLYTAPHRIGIPVAAGAAGDLAITGLRDGGGGITLGIQTTDGALLTPVIAPGQVLSMRLR